MRLQEEAAENLGELLTPIEVSDEMKRLREQPATYRHEHGVSEKESDDPVTVVKRALVSERLFPQFFWGLHHRLPLSCVTDQGLEP